MQGIINISATKLPIEMILSLHFDFQGSVIYLGIFVAAAVQKWWQLQNSKTSRIQYCCWQKAHTGLITIARG